MGATQTGVILGTAAYMAPEQARGKAVDRRADIWAFGVVLYEMLAGRRPFQGEDASETLAAVIKEEPDWNALPGDTPATIRHLLCRCLAKDPRQRLRDMGDFRLFSEPTPDDPASGKGGPAMSAALPLRRRIVPWALTTVFLSALAFTLALWPPWRMAAPPFVPLHLSMEAGPDLEVGGVGNGRRLALSPDGGMLAFTGRKIGSGTKWQLYVRKLDQLQAVPLPGTEGAGSHFFSPDGQWIAFFSNLPENKWKKISVTGGIIQPLLESDIESTGGRPGSWTRDGMIMNSLPETS